MSKNLLIIATSVIFFGMILHPEFVLSAEGLELISGKGCYTYGDNDTPMKARELALEIAKRNAIESFRVLVDSATRIENFELKRDVVNSISGAYLYDMKILEESERGRELCVSIEAKVNPDEVDRVIAEKRLTNDLGLPGTDDTEKVREGIIDWDRKVVRVKGFGGANTAFPEYLWKKSAEDAARIDAQTKMLGLIDGLQIESRTFLDDRQVNLDRKIIEVRGKIKNARQVGTTLYPTEKTAEVIMELDLRGVLDK